MRETFNLVVVGSSPSLGDRFYPDQQGKSVAHNRPLANSIQKFGKEAVKKTHSAHFD
jgi:hypothetical protein